MHDAELLDRSCGRMNNTFVIEAVVPHLRKPCLQEVTNRYGILYCLVASISPDTRWCIISVCPKYSRPEIAENTMVTIQGGQCLTGISDNYASSTCNAGEPSKEPV